MGKRIYIIGLVTVGITVGGVLVLIILLPFSTSTGGI